MIEKSFELTENTEDGIVDKNDIDFNNISILSIAGVKVPRLRITIKFFKKEDKIVDVEPGDMVKILAICREVETKDLAVYTGKINDIIYNQFSVNTYAPIIKVDCSNAYGSKIVSLKLSDIRDIVKLDYVPENKVEYYTKEEIDDKLSWTVIE